MEKQMPSGLKIVFLIHLIVGLIFGLTYLLIPETWGSMVNWPIKDPPLYRLLGAAMLGISVTSWLGFKATYWETVRITVVMEIVWTILGTIVMLWGLIFADLPAIGWMNTIILAIFAIVFCVFFFKGRKETETT